MTTSPNARRALGAVRGRNKRCPRTACWQHAASGEPPGTAGILLDSKGFLDARTHDKRGEEPHRSAFWVDAPCRKSRVVTRRAKIQTGSHRNPSLSSHLIASPLPATPDMPSSE